MTRMNLKPRYRALQFSLALLVLVGLALASFLKPETEDFDRYIYEAILRSQSGQALVDVHQSVRHASARAEASSLIETPELMQHQYPFYAIRPAYIAAISVIHGAGLGYQQAIRAVSTFSYVALGVIVILGTKRIWLGLLLTMAPFSLELARRGTPDALSTATLLGACLLILNTRWRVPGVILLAASVWIRTDNVLFVLAFLTLLALHRSLDWRVTLAGCTFAVASVLGINRVAGNYGWIVLFRHSFIGGRDPVESLHYVTFNEYFGALSQGLRDGVAHSHLTIALLAGAVVIQRCGQNSLWKSALWSAILAATARFVLFPSLEDRYFAWAYLLVGVFALQQLNRATSRQFVTTN